MCMRSPGMGWPRQLHPQPPHALRRKPPVLLPWRATRGLILLQLGRVARHLPTRLATTPDVDCTRRVVMPELRNGRALRRRVRRMMPVVLAPQRTLAWY